MASDYFGGEGCDDELASDYFGGEGCDDELACCLNCDVGGARLPCGAHLPCGAGFLTNLGGGGLTASCKLKETEKRLASSVEVAPAGSAFSGIPFDVVGEQSVRLPTVE